MKGSLRLNLAHDQKSLDTTLHWVWPIDIRCGNSGPVKGVLEVYLPAHFENRSEESLIRFVNQFSFACVFCVDAKLGLLLGHLPLIWKKKSSSSDSTSDSEKLKLLGHMSRQNPLWKGLETNANCTVVIQGPHSYVSPRWYHSDRNVPTWNYSAVQLSCAARLIHDGAQQIQVLSALAEVFENKNVRFEELPSDLGSEKQVETALVSFELEVLSFEFKEKISQNRSEEDRKGVIAGLRLQGDENSVWIASRMEQTLEALKGT
jgi:transcriptional regulator